MPNTICLLLWPWVALVPVWLLRRRRWAHLLGAAALAVEAWACLRFLPDAGMVLLDRTVHLGESGRLALAWVAGASALLALAAAVHKEKRAVALGLLPLTSVAGIALAVDPLPLGFAALWLIIPLATLSYQPGDASTHSGILRFLTLPALGLPPLLLASSLISQTPLIAPDQPPPWGTVAVLIVLVCAAWLSLFPFHTWAPGLARSANPLVSGWILGVFQPLVLLTVIRTFGAYPEIPGQPGALKIVQVVALGSMAIGAAFAASADRAGHVWGYSSVMSLGWLLFMAVSGAAMPTPLYWLVAAIYSASTILVSIGMLGVGGESLSKPLRSLAGIARARGGSVALLLVGGLALCALPLSAAGLERGTASVLPSGVGSAVVYIAPLLASVGWWRLLWASVQRGHRTEAPTGVGGTLLAWLLTVLAVASLVWAGVWLRLGEAFVRALGGS